MPGPEVTASREADEFGAGDDDERGHRNPFQLASASGGMARMFLTTMDGAAFMASQKKKSDFTACSSMNLAMAWGLASGASERGA